MTPTEWLVIAVGVAAIALVNWWFFLAEPPAGRTRDAHQHHHH
jgi:hypothetical protein